MASRNTHRGSLDFYFDIEATDLNAGDRQPKLVLFRDDGFGNKASILEPPQRTVGAQLLEFYGGFHRAGSDTLHGVINENVKNNLPGGVRYDDFELSFERTTGETVDTNAINRILQLKRNNNLPQGSNDAHIFNEMTSGRGKMSVVNRSVLNQLVVSNASTPEFGHFGAGVTQVGSTLNKILAKNVFEAKFNHGNMRTTDEVISRFLTDFEGHAFDRQGNVKNEINMRGWNVSYDIKLMASNIDNIGNQDHIDKFKKLFLDQNAPVKLHDEADKLKNMNFELMVRDADYSVYHLDRRAMDDQFKLTGQSATNAIRTDFEQGFDVRRQGHQEVTSNFVTEHTSMKQLAGDVRGQRASNRSLSQLENLFLDRVKGNRRGVSSNEQVIVKEAAKLVHELGHVNRPESSIDSIRKSINAVRHLDVAELTFNRIWQAGNSSGIMGFNPARRISSNGASLFQDMLGFQQSRATGLDVIGGHSLSGGDGGLLNAFVQAKETYGETIRSRGGSVSNELSRVFDEVVSMERSASGQAHTASVDTQRMMNISTEIMGRNPAHQANDQVLEFFGHVMRHNQLGKATEELDRLTSTAQMSQESLTSMRGYITPSSPAQQTVQTAGDSLSNLGNTVADNTRHATPSVQRGLNTKGGVLARAAFIASGMVLVGNQNSDIKNPNSRHNLIEGVSPSGDPLLHSFGSGNDRYNSQAINSLKYNFNMGSETLRSSTLGYQGERLYNQLLGRNTFIDHTKSSQRGEIAHKIIEQEYMSKGLAQAREHYVYSSELDVVGHVDLVLKSGVPLEIKTVADFEALKELRYPREKHVSQANFYAYALDQPYALIGYAARNDPSKIKYFKINTDIDRVRREVKTVRGAMKDLKAQGHQVTTYSAYQYMKDAHANFTQEKYQKDAMGVAPFVPNGMLMSPEDYEGYSAIRSLGDYSNEQAGRKKRSPGHSRGLRQEARAFNNQGFRYHKQTHGRIKDTAKNMFGAKKPQSVIGPVASRAGTGA